jgi:hypothetical protein
MIAEATEFLLKHQNPDGGWGSVPGKVSNTESTSLSTLALLAVPSGSVDQSIKNGSRWLVEHQRTDGSWPLNAGMKEGSWATTIAVFGLSGFPDYQGSALKGADWLVNHPGSGLPLLASILVRLSITKFDSEINPDLIGWSWTSGSFSWVEPTAYALIALKKLKPHFNTPDASKRVHEAESMIYDRMCEGGGWNHGSTSVYGMKSWPYAEVTALTLIAMQDHADAAANRLSLKALEKMLGEDQSGLALSWSILCFLIYGVEVGEWRKALAKSFAETGFLNETKSIALSLLASGEGAGVFRL